MPVSTRVTLDGLAHVEANRAVDAKEYKQVLTGAGYSVNTTLSVTGGFGEGAVLIPRFSNGILVDMIIENNGYGYFNVPTITIAPPGTVGGITATATAVINGRGQITNVIITNQGKNYNIALDSTTGSLILPKVTVTGVPNPGDSLPQLMAN